MKRRIVICLMSLVTAIVCSISISASSGVFTDVSSKAWYHDDVIKAYDRGLVKGINADTFAPENSLTRAEYITLLSRLHGASPDSENPFSDVSKDAWYAQYVGWAVKAGIINGYEDNTFRANNSITREELMVMTARYVRYAWIELNDVPDAILRFADDSKIASWAAGDVDSMRRSGIVRGDSCGNFNPKGTATRAEIATLINRLYDYADSFDRSPRIAGVPLGEYSLYSECLSQERLGEIADIFKASTGVDLPISDNADGKVIAFEIDPSLRRLEYSITEHNGCLLFAVSTEYAAPYFARIVDGAISSRRQFVIARDYTALGTYEIDEVPLDDVSAVSFLCETDKNPLAYSTGDSVTFRVTLLDGDRVVSVPQFIWEYKVEDGRSSSGYLSGHAGQFVLECDGSKIPGAAQLTVYAANRRGVNISVLSEKIMNASVIFDFYKITPAAQVPEDFNEYWDSVMAELEEIEPTAIEFKVCEHIHIDGYTVYDAAVATNGDPAYVHITVPNGAAPGTLRISAGFSGYGQPSSCGVGTDSNCISVSVNPHSVKSHAEEEYYSAVAAKIQGWGFDNPSRDESYFFGMLCRDIMAIRFVETQFSDLWNGIDISVSGGSMGGFQSIAVAGIYSKVNSVYAYIPWMCDIGGNSLAKRFPGWRPGYNDASKYYDSCNFATRISDCRVLINAGLGDGICPPSGVVSLYNFLTCEKELTMNQCQDHGTSGGPYNRSYKVSSDSPNIGTMMSVISDPGAAVHAPDYSANRTLTASEETMKACADSARKGILSVTYGYSSDITSEGLEAIIGKRLASCGLPSGCTVEVDDDTVTQVVNSYRNTSDGGIVWESVSYTIFDGLGGYWDATLNVEFTKDLTSAETQEIREKFAKVFDQDAYVIIFDEGESVTEETITDRILMATGYIVDIVTPISSIPTDGTPVLVSGTVVPSYSEELIEIEFTLRLNIQ